ncbi:Uncharacterised protein [Lysinibacillus sphaericus]|nr:Uncharacterised protein [Lysinibacillus sphaericus]
MNVFDRDYKDNKHIEDRTATAFWMWFFARNIGVTQRMYRSS